jgi:uncharacterized membrane protein YvlD (DUF360 family)
MLGYIATFLVIAIIFLVMIRVSIGLDVDSRKRALWAAFAIGLLNAVVQFLAGKLSVPNIQIVLLLLAIVVNAIMLYAMSALAKGFRVNGCINGLIAATVLALLNTCLYWLWGVVGA